MGKTGYVYEGVPEGLRTDDPAYPGGLVPLAGACFTLTVDGRPVASFARFRTGRDGWLEDFVRDANGGYVVLAGGRVKTRTDGDVRFKLVTP